MVTVDNKNLPKNQALIIIEGRIFMTSLPLTCGAIDDIKLRIKVSETEYEEIKVTTNKCPCKKVAPTHDTQDFGG